jgi:hypothetical protein
VDAETQRELAATVEARRELGPEHEDALVERFLERIEKEIDRRVEEKVARRERPHHPVGRSELGVSVPVVIFAGVFGGPAGVMVALVALAIVFVVLTLSRR